MSKGDWGKAQEAAVSGRRLVDRSGADIGHVSAAGEAVPAAQYFARQAFVIGGQSNADGRGVMTSPSPGAPNVWMLDKGGNFRIAAEPLAEQVSGWINNTPAGATPGIPAHSFGVEMGKCIARETGVWPLLVPCSLGSTSLTNWRAPVGELTMASLFGALILRARQAQVAGLNPVFVWFGHEANAADTTVNLSTGVLGNGFLWKWIDLVTEVRAHFPGAHFLFCQLSIMNSDDPRYCLTGEIQRRMVDMGGPAYAGYVPVGNPVAKNTNASNAIVVNGNGSITMTGDGSTTLGFTFPVAAGFEYVLTMSVSGSGLFKLAVPHEPYVALGSGVHTLTFTPGDTELGIYRNNVGMATNLTFSISSLLSFAAGQVSNHHMAVTHDVPRNAGVDSQHLSDVGFREVGRRLALLYADRVLKLPGVDGLGPRLVSVGSISTTQTRVKFSQPIAAAKAGEQNYSDGVNSLFRVYDGGTERAVSAVVIDGVDPTAVIITHASCVSVRVLSYGDRPGQDAVWRKGAVYNTTSPIPLPAPMFVSVAAP